MLNQYPLWKYLLIIFVVGLGFFYASPNLYAPDAAIQISGESSAMQLDEETLSIASKALDKADIVIVGQELGENNGSALIRLSQRDDQLAAKRLVENALGDGYIVALNLAPTTPSWLTSWGGQPMKLGLDLSGGVHFLLEVDTAAAVSKRMGFNASNIKRKLREEKIRGFIKYDDAGLIEGKFKSDELRGKARSVIRSEFPGLTAQTEDQDGDYLLYLTMSEATIKEIEDYAVAQNLTTLRNRVNELGVAEPLVQRQGRNRIVVQLPGIQDTAEAKRILGKTANLEFRLEAKFNAPSSEKEEFSFRDPDRPDTAFLEKDIVITGESVAGAQAGFDPISNQPQVNITLDSDGGALMHRVTRKNIQRRLGVLYIERKSRTEGFTTNELGERVPVKVDYDEKKMISLATIQDALGVQFRITGLDNPAEASELALLLRAGALAAPMKFVEERTVGPSLGAENIRLGVLSVQIGLGLVAAFMVFWYRLFGMTAVFAVSVNLVLLVAMMSLLSATLTLPGIAGIVLTVGMAVDANVLIFARIREELKAGTSPQQAISRGYDRAFVTIIDANLTTLLVAVILYAVGTGPIKGFAVTLSIGIVTSMFTAIMGTRAIINLTYGRKKNLKSISIGSAIPAK